jgi:antitoxin MazE
MNIAVIPIGNSKGIRLGKSILEKYNIKDAVELVLEKDCIVIKPVSTPRKGWENAFKKMHEKGDDKLLMADYIEDETLEEWN